MISYLLRLITSQWIPEEANWIFSLHKVPEYLVFYALGSFLWQIYKWFLDKSSAYPWLRKSVAVLVFCTAAAYMTVVYFEKYSQLWQWTEGNSAALLRFVPEIVLIIFALVMNCSIAKIVSNNVTVSLGRETLYLCLCEKWVKEMMAEIAGIVGVTLVVGNPTQSVIMSLAALIAAYYTAVPLTKYLMKTVAGKPEEICK